MIFGDRLSAAESAEPAAWVADTVNFERWGTVGGLLPEHFESYVLIEAAPPVDEDWWAAQRENIVALAAVLAQFTQTPDVSWFAVWEGHGFDSRHTFLAWMEDSEPTSAQWAEMRADQAALKVEDARWTTKTRAALGGIPTFALPYRTHYLMGGSVSAVEAMRWPDELEDRWFGPDLWWPQDRQWFFATDVDFWCSYVGGSKALTDEIMARLPDLCRTATLDEELRDED